MVLICLVDSDGMDFTDLEKPDSLSHSRLGGNICQMAFDSRQKKSSGCMVAASLFHSMLFFRPKSGDLISPGGMVEEMDLTVS